MDESWRDLREIPERIRWARLRTEYTRPVNLADSLGIKRGTYRTYEQLKADGGRVPPLREIQRIAAKLKVPWQWIAAGTGSPFELPIDDFAVISAQKITRKLEDVPVEKREDAQRAVEAVLDAFSKAG